MKPSSFVFAFVGMALGAALTIFIVGCNNEITFRHDPLTKEVTVVPKTGDVLLWDVAVTWRSGGAGPCEPTVFASSGNKKCQIVAAANKLVYTYRCEAGKYCDPDVAVDDDYRPFILTTARTTSTAPAAAAAAADDPTEAYVYLQCTDGKVDIDPGHKNDRKVGEAVQWRSTGPLHLAAGWKVVLQGAGAATFCTSAKTELTEADECILAGPAGTPIDYTVKATGCSEPSPLGTVTPQ